MIYNGARAVPVYKFKSVFIASIDHKFATACKLLDVNDFEDNIETGITAQEQYEDEKQFYDMMQFKPSRLFEDLALGTGIGLRYNLGFLVVRLDWGIALHFPYDTGKSGYFNINRFKDAHTLHFAIGYPF